MASSRMKSSASRHYHRPLVNLPESDVRDGLVGLGLFAVEDMPPGTLVAEYFDNRMTHAAAEWLRERRAGAFTTDEYFLSVEGRDVVIDALWKDYEGKSANKSCAPSAWFVSIRLDASEQDALFIEMVVDVPSRTEVLANYGWSVLMSREGVLCDCSTEV